MAVILRNVGFVRLILL